MPLLSYAVRRESMLLRQRYTIQHGILVAVCAGRASSMFLAICLIEELKPIFASVGVFLLFPRTAACLSASTPNLLL